MVVEIDQSGKLEQLDTGTAIAFANGESGAIWIAAKIKRGATNLLRKTLIPTSDLRAILFAILTYILVEKLPKDIVLKIDEEYTGKERVIAETLEKLLVRKLTKNWRGKIRFEQIGKHSPAHRLAWSIHRQKNKQRVRGIKLEEISRLLK